MEKQFNPNYAAMDKSILLFGLVSNGKSTLVNALLGKVVMPVSNLSSTSLLVKVFDRLEENVYGKAFYLYNDVHIEYDKQDAVSALHYYNDSMGCYGEFCIYESLRTLNKYEFQLTLLDTPGINDALSTKRSNVALQSILYDKESMLLYVSHIRTCGTSDEEQCLRSVSGRIRHCRDNEWFFVVNGWDMKNDEEEFSYISKIRILISKCDLPQPQIFFISALGALVCRRMLSGEELRGLDRKQFEHILRYYGMYEHLERCKGNKSLEKKFIQDTLFFTGVPKLEEALYRKIKIYTNAAMQEQIVS